MAGNQGGKPRTLRDTLEMLSLVLGIIVAAIAIVAAIPKLTVTKEDYYTESGVHVGNDVLEYYKDLNRPQWTAYKKDALTLQFGKRPMRVTGGSTELPTIAVFPVQAIPVTLSLIEYHTGNVAYEHTAQISNGGRKIVIPESDIKEDTLYYYVMKSDGFKTVVSDEPFYLNTTSETAFPKWLLFLEEKDFSYERPFIVRLLDVAGNPIVNHYFENKNPFTIQDSAEPHQWETNIDWVNFSTTQDGFARESNGIIKFEIQADFTLKIRNADGSLSDVTLKYTSVDPNEPDIATAIVSIETPVPSE